MRDLFQYYSDPGHGWLRVHRGELEELGISDEISSSSYEHGGDVYLEHDVDAGIFISAWEDHVGHKWDFVQNAYVISINHSSGIRDMPRYKGGS